MKGQNNASEFSASRRGEGSRRSNMPLSRHCSQSRAAKYSKNLYELRFQKVLRSPEGPNSFIRPPLLNVTDIEGAQPKTSPQKLTREHGSLNVTDIHGTHPRRPVLYYKNKDLIMNVDDIVKRQRKAHSALKFVNYCTNFSNPQLKKPSHYFLHKYPMEGFHIEPHAIEEAMYPERIAPNRTNPLNKELHSIRTRSPEWGNSSFEQTVQFKRNPELEKEKSFGRREKLSQHSMRSPLYENPITELSLNNCKCPKEYFQTHRRNQSYEAQRIHYQPIDIIKSPKKRRELPPLQSHNIELQKCQKKSHHNTKEKVRIAVEASKELSDNSFTHFYGKEPDKRDLFYSEKISEPMAYGSMNSPVYKKINIDKMLIFGGYQRKVIPTFYSQVPIGAGSNLICH